VRRDAVAALVAHTHGQVHQFLGERIERARPHDLLDVFPRALQRGRIGAIAFQKLLIQSVLRVVMMSS